MNGGNHTEELVPLREWGKEYGNKLSDLSKVDASALVGIAEKVGDYLVNGRYQEGRDVRKVDLKMNQVRKFLDATRRIEAKLKGIRNKRFEDVSDEIVLLRPKLAYAAGREKKVFPLVNVLDPAIKSGAKSQENFMKLLRLIEGIIAYHRFAGGSN